MVTISATLREISSSLLALFSAARSVFRAPMIARRLG
jgi:hypothetical protein